MKKPFKIILATLAVICAVSAPVALYINRKRSGLYGHFVKSNTYNYDLFMNFYNRNIKNKNEKAFILDLRSEFEEDFFLVRGLHDCGRHMLLCKDSDSFHYLRNTFYRQSFNLTINDYHIYCYIFYQQYYELDNPNLEWVEVDGFYEIPGIILSLSPALDSIFYELYDTTQEKCVLKLEFCFDGTHKNSEIIDDVKNKLLTKFTETYL